MFVVAQAAPIAKQQYRQGLNIIASDVDGHDAVKSHGLPHIGFNAHHARWRCTCDHMCTLLLYPKIKNLKHAARCTRANAHVGAYAPVRASLRVCVHHCARVCAYVHVHASVHPRVHVDSAVCVFVCTWARACARGCMRGCARVMPGRDKRHARAPTMQCPAGSQFIEFKSKTCARGTDNRRATNSKILVYYVPGDPGHWLLARPAKEKGSDEVPTLHNAYVLSMPAPQPFHGVVVMDDLLGFTHDLRPGICKNQTACMYVLRQKRAYNICSCIPNTRPARITT